MSEYGEGGEDSEGGDVTPYIIEADISLKNYTCLNDDDKHIIVVHSMYPFTASIIDLEDACLKTFVKYETTKDWEAI